MQFFSNGKISASEEVKNTEISNSPKSRGRLSMLMALSRCAMITQNTGQKIVPGELSNRNSRMRRWSNMRTLIPVTDAM